MCYPNQVLFTGKGGYDKKYYHNKCDKYGWLEFKDKKLIESERKCYESLCKIEGVNLPEAHFDTPKPLLMHVDPSNCQQAECGYFIRHLNIIKTIKPVMCRVEFNPKSIGIQETSQICNAICDLKRLSDTKVLKTVLSTCGELTLAFDLSDNRFYLLDYGYGDGISNIDGILGGIQKMINSLEELLKYLSHMLSSD